MGVLKHIRKLWEYYCWERKTEKICKTGKEITHIINEKYQKLDTKSCIYFVKTGDFTKLGRRLQKYIEYRECYWLEKDKQRLTDKCITEPVKLQIRFKEYKSLGNATAVFGVFVWLHSFKQIIDKAIKRGTIRNDGIYRSCSLELERLIDKGVKYFQGISRKDKAKVKMNTSIYHTKILESDLKYIIKHCAKNIKNIFTIIDKGEKVFHVEVYERWDFKNNEIKICVPVSVGCHNKCNQCQVGQYISSLPGTPRLLTSNELFELIYTNSLINDEVTQISYKPISITIFYLGGGDPANNIDEFERIVDKLHKYYYDPGNRSPFIQWIRRNFELYRCGESLSLPFRQIASTIGIRNKSIDRIVKLGYKYPEFGFQISANALNDEVRSFYINNKDALDVRECVKAAQDFYDYTYKSGYPRRGYIGIFLLEEEYNDPYRILNELEELRVDPSKVVISLEVLKDVPDKFSKKGHKVSSLKGYRKVKRCLEKNGYKAVIYEAPDDSATHEGCGLISEDLLELFRKSRKVL